MKSAEIKPFILIVGSGLAGLTVALTLKQNDLDVAIVSPNFPKREFTRNLDETKLTPEILYGSGRTTALLQSSHTFLDAIGIWSKVSSQATALKTMSLIDDQDSNDKPYEVAFNPTELQTDEASIDAFGFNVSNAILQDALLDEIEKLEIPIHHTSVVGLDTGTAKAVVRCQNGEVLNASLVIGADGANSTIRNLSRIDVEEHVFDQLAFTMVLKHEKPHDFTSTEFQKKQGPLTIVPLEDNHASIVWVHQKQRALDYISNGTEFLLKKLKDEMHGILGDLELLAGPGKFPVISRRSETLYAGRVTLIAEAAHAMPPIGAQGLNSSLMDVAHLSNILIEAFERGVDFSSKPQIAKLFKRYADIRHNDIKMRFKAVNALNYMVTTKSAAVANIRQTGLSANRDSQVVRNFFVERGMMWAKDLPQRFQ